MVVAPKNSLDLLRLMAAGLVLYGHQHVLTGLAEPLFLGLTTFGGTGVSIFFFLSGFLVWSSWDRDPHVGRFVVRRSLRIFPGLWLVVGGTVFLLGPTLSSFSRADYFSSPQTWGYLDNGLLLGRWFLPGVFEQNPYPFAVNGSLWTLPVEFFCYATVVVIGLGALVHKKWAVSVGLLLAVLSIQWGLDQYGPDFTVYFEMIAFFWWGVWYGYANQQGSIDRNWVLFWSVVALLLFVTIGARGVERTVMLLLVVWVVIAAQRTSIGAFLPRRVGDLSYGLYIFAFPVQQLVAQWGLGRAWPFVWSLCLSFLITSGLAYASWHLIEKQALKLKPHGIWAP